MFSVHLQAHRLIGLGAYALPPCVRYRQWYACP
jgi:hypothetical protein